MPELSLTYHITLDDFVAAQRAHQRRNTWGKVQYGLGMVLFGWFLLLAVFSLIFTPGVWLNYTLPLLLAGAYLYIYYFAHRRAYRENAGLFSDVAVDVGDEGVHVVTAHSESTVPWSRYQRWVESDKVFLLYVGERTFNIIPKRILSGEQQEELRKLLTKKVILATFA
jgi:hypothetical protein